MDLDDDCLDCAIIREYKSCEDPFLRAEYAAAHGLSESYIRSLPCWRGCVAARRRRRSVVTVTTTTSWSPFRVVTVIRIEK